MTGLSAPTCSVSTRPDSTVGAADEPGKHLAGEQRRLELLFQQRLADLQHARFERVAEIAIVRPGPCPIGCLPIRDWAVVVENLAAPTAVLAVGTAANTA